MSYTTNYSTYRISSACAICSTTDVSYKPLICHTDKPATTAATFGSSLTGLYFQRPLQLRSGLPMNL